MKKFKKVEPSHTPHLKLHPSNQRELIELQKPVFCFQYLSSNYSILKCTKDEKSSLADKLQQLSSLTWAELHQSGRHQIGYEIISRNALKVAVPASIKEDATFIAFRFHGKAPMIGYREKNIFHVIWLDRDFTVYNHG